MRKSTKMMKAKMKFTIVKLVGPVGGGRTALEVGGGLEGIAIVPNEVKEGRQSIFSTLGQIGGCGEQEWRGSVGGWLW